MYVYSSQIAFCLCLLDSLKEGGEKSSIYLSLRLPWQHACGCLPDSGGGGREEVGEKEKLGPLADLAIAGATHTHTLWRATGQEQAGVTCPHCCTGLHARQEEGRKKKEQGTVCSNVAMAIASLLHMGGSLPTMSLPSWLGRGRRGEGI